MRAPAQPTQYSNSLLKQNFDAFLKKTNSLNKITFQNKICIFHMYHYFLYYYMTQVQKIFLKKCIFSHFW